MSSIGGSGWQLRTGNRSGSFGVASQVDVYTLSMNTYSRQKDNLDGQSVFLEWRATQTHKMLCRVAA